MFLRKHLFYRTETEKTGSSKVMFGPLLLFIFFTNTISFWIHICAIAQVVGKWKNYKNFNYSLMEFAILLYIENL